MTSKYQYTYELWLKQSQYIASSPTIWMDFLKTASWMFKYRFEDQILIYAQKPNAKACADYNTWNNRMNRWIKKNSKGIVLLDKKPEKLRYVFDIDDTWSPSHSVLQLWTIDEQNYDEIVEMINNKYGPFPDRQNLPEVIIEMAEVIAEENCQDYVSSLIKYNQGSNLEIFEEIEIKQAFKMLVRNSIAYEIMYRCGIDPNEYFDDDDFYDIRNFDTVDTIGQLGITCHDLCEMVLLDISSKAREIMIRTFEQTNKISQNRNIEIERSTSYERNHIQPSRRLSNAELERGTTSTQQLLRKVEIPLSERESSGTSVRTQSEERVEQTFSKYRDGGKHTNGQDDGTVINPISSSKQRNPSDGLGTTYEQSQGNRKRDDSQGNNLQLDLGFDIEDGKDDLKLPSFNLHDLPVLLRCDISLKHTREEIVDYFRDHDESQRAHFIACCYDDTLVQTFRAPERYDYSYIGYKKNGEGLDVWSGNYLEPKSKSFLSFMQIQNEIVELIDKNEYLQAPFDKMNGLQKAYQMEVINANVDYHLFRYHEQLTIPSAEIISYFKEHIERDEQAAFIMNAYQDGIVEWQENDVPLGYKKYEDHLHIYLGTYDNQVVSQDLTWSNVASQIEGMIISRYFDEAIQIPTFEEQQSAVYENEESLKNGIYFSQAEIDKVLVKGSGFEQGKFRIQQYFLKPNSLKEKADFLKDEYGIGGSSPAYGRISIDYNARGLQLKRSREIGNDEIKVTLPWIKVAVRINDLIQFERYLSKEEVKQYPLFLEQQIQNKISYEESIRDQSTYVEVIESTEEPVKKDYQWDVGDTVYIGVSEYEIIKNGETIILQDKEFPLFSEEYSAEQLRQVLKENPLNDKLLKHIVINQINNHDLLYEKYLPMFIRRIKMSSIYAVLKDSTSILEDAYNLIQSEMISIIGSMNQEYPEAYQLYTSDETFRKRVINGIVEQTYEDIKDVVIQTIESEDAFYNLYDVFKKITPRIASQESCFQIWMSRYEKEYPLSISFDSTNNKISILHYYEINGIEVNEPYMEFIVDLENQLLRPTYYSNQLLGLSYDIDNIEVIQQEDVINEISDYALRWFNNILNKDYYLESEQLYKDNSHNTGIYHIDYDENKEVKFSDMPYRQLVDFCEKEGYTLSKDIRSQKEIQFLESLFMKLNLKDIELSWDDDNHEVIAADGNHLWAGKQLYDYLKDEIFIYENQVPLGMTKDDINQFNDYYLLQKEAVIHDIQKTNFKISDEHIGAGTPKERYRNNIAAIKLLFSLEKQGRLATSEEQEILAKYVGWGGLADVFDESKSNWQNEYQELKVLLNEKEYSDARESTLTSFYTPPIVIDSIYKVLENLGFRYGNILEPACGIGNFMGRLPQKMNESKLYGVELDSITGRIAKQLYQEANIAIEGYEKTKLPDSFFDVSIGNVRELLGLIA